MEPATQIESRVRYVLSLNGTSLFAILGPGWELKEKTAHLERASLFDSMSEATMAALMAGLNDFTVKPHAPES